MLHTPPIAPSHPRPKRRLQTLQRHIPMAHNRLPQIIKAMTQMLRRILAFPRETVVVFLTGHLHGEGAVVEHEVIEAVHDHIEAVELVGYGSGVDGFGVFEVRGWDVAERRVIGD